MVNKKTKKIRNHHNKSVKVKKLEDENNECPSEVQPIIKDFFEENRKELKSKSVESLAKQYIKKIDSPPAPSSIKPYNDYYHYINHKWLESSHIDKKQKYIVEVDDFRLTQHKVYKELDDIILKYINSHNNRLAKDLKTFRNSVIKMTPISYSLNKAKEIVKTIDNLIEEGNPWKFLAYFNSQESINAEAPFSFTVAADDKEPEVFRCYLDGHQFELVDINVYFDDGKEVSYKKKQRDAYRDNCNKIFKTCLGSNNGLNGSDVFDVEVELINNYSCTVIKEKVENNYKRINKTEALKTYGFDWESYSKYLGFKTPPPFFITGDLNYLKCTTDSFLKNWKSPKWRSYWFFILFKRLCRFTHDWEKIIYEFYGNYQRGEQGINNSDAVSAALYMSVPFNNFLTTEYIKLRNSPPTNRLTNVLCNDLKKCFKRILESNTWLSPVTKQKALHKLAQFRFIVGHYNKELDDPVLPYTNILYENMELVSNWRHKTWISLEGKKERPMPMMDWMDYPVKMTGTQAYIVNASYTPAKNAIYINLGYMQEPFIDFKKGLEYNLAHLGFTIGHEMSHGFDDMGSKYNGKGKLDNWWTAKDAAKFKQKQKEVIGQYELFAKRDKIYYDASIGIGEDMADISGLGIVLLYLRSYNQFIKNSDSISKLSFEKFFVFFAEQQKQKINKHAISAQLKTNPHPLNKYRCNIPLSRSTIFSVIYNVKKGDGMYWPNKNFIWY